MDVNTFNRIAGVDLAKDIIQICYTDMETGEVLNKKVSRNKFLEFFANRPTSMIGMEACGGAHHWARELKSLGHEVILIPGRDVKAFNYGNKDDANDARAIWAATRSGTVRSVNIKTEEQQSILALHRTRDMLIRQRVATTNHIRGILTEFGLVTAKGKKALKDWLPSALEELSSRVTPMLISELELLWQGVKRLNEQVAGIERNLNQWAKSNEACGRLLKIDGVGFLTATAVVATVGDASMFMSARQMAAFFGLVPKHIGSGGKVRNLGMSKRGNGYIRRLVIHGARSVVNCLKEPLKVVKRMLAKGHKKNVVVGAVANRLLRIMWSMLVHGTQYERNHVSVMCQA